MERRTTFREEDQITRLVSILQKRSASPPLNLPEEYATGPAFACLGSSKQHRLNIGKMCENEDRICLGTVMVEEEPGTCEHIIFAGLFDGHGGGGKASSFVCERILRTFETVLAEVLANPESQQLSLSEKISTALERSFYVVDLEFHKAVKAEAAKANMEKKGRTDCCKYFKEDPCICMNPPIPANEGSTGTVIIVTRTHVICANVGDSDAFLVEQEPPPVTVASTEANSREETESGTSSPSSNGSASDSTAAMSDAEDDLAQQAKRARLATVTSPCALPPSIVLNQLTITDTPIPDDANEDYRRIRGVAQRSAQQLAATMAERRVPFLEKMPQDGIIRSARGDRFNYVAVAGARSLNMVRAFGNLGNKRFVDDKIVEDESPIIARPHMSVTRRTDAMCAVIVGSDGLWDNVDRSDVADVIGRHLSLDAAAHEARQASISSSSSQPMAPPPLPSSVPQSLVDRSKSCAKELLNKAIRAKRKPDDVSVVVIPLSALLLRSISPTSKEYAWL